MLRLKHLPRLVRDVVAYSIASRSWWLVPVLMTLGLVALAAAATQAVVPYAVYTLF